MAELERQVGAVAVAAEDHDLLGAEAPGGQQAAEADRSVADDRDSPPALDAGADGGMVTGGEDVGEGEQRRA